MNFGFTEEQELLRKTARDFLAESAPMKVAAHNLREKLGEGHLGFVALYELLMKLVLKDND